MKTVTCCNYADVAGVPSLVSVDTDQGLVVFDPQDVFPAAENWTHWPDLSTKYGLTMPGLTLAGSKNTPPPVPG